MSTSRQAGLITIFTPSFADEENTNAQNLTVKEIVARLPEDEFRVTMLCQSNPDPRLISRRNTIFLSYQEHGNTMRLATRLMISAPDIYFYPRTGPLDRVFFTMRRCLRLRTAVVTHIVMEMNAETATSMIRRSILEGDAVFGNSEFVSRTVRERFGVEAATIHNGIDRRFFFPPDVRRNGTKCCNVLYAGSFQRRKRVDLVIRAAAHWPQVAFYLAGRGETEASCRELCEHLGCRNVTFLGHLSLSALGDALRKADVFVFPSILEGHPQVLGQAAACGVPAIAMSAYQPEYVVNGRTGFLVESDQELNLKLELLLTNPELRQSMSNAAVNHSRNFDWEKIAATWAHVFKSVVVSR